MDTSSSSRQGRTISVFVLVMLNVSIMASLRNLPLVAEYGFSALFFFAVVLFLFLLPQALVSAELATAWPKSGGIYVWVREAFGDKAGFFAIWMQWVHNVTWYPAILSFVASTLGYVFYPELANNRHFALAVTLIGFWGMTFLNFKAFKTSSIFSTVGVIIGTIIPGLIIIALGASYVFSGGKLQIHMQLSEFIPDFSHIDNLVFLGGLFLAFAGLEVSAGYAGEVKNPQKNYPKAIMLAAFITFFLFMLGSLSIASVIPKNEISLVSGVMEATRVFLDEFNLSWFLPVMGILLVMGAVAETNSWIIGPVKALYVTAHNGDLHPYFQHLNAHKMPTHLLIFQAIIVSFASCVFLFMPNLSSAFWILSALSTQIYLVMYIMMFAAAIRLRYTRPNVPRAYQIPHPHRGIWLVASIGALTSLGALVVFFIPPKQLEVGNLWFYESFLIGGLVIMSAIPLILHSLKKPDWHPLYKKD